MAGRAAIAVLSLGFAIAVARVLSPDARGEFAILQTVTGLAFVVGNASISRAAIHHIGKGLMSRRDTASVTLSLAVVSGALGAVLLIPIVLSIRDWAAPTLDGAWLVGAMFLSIPWIARDYLAGILIAGDRPVGVVTAHAAQPAAAIAILVALLTVGAYEGVTSVFWAWGASLVGSAVFAALITLRPLRAVPRLPRRMDRSLIVLGLKSYPANLARFLNLRLDQLLVAGLASVTALGYYSVAVNVGELLLQIPVVMLWALSGAISSTARQASAQLVMEFCRWSVFIVLAVVIVIAIVAPVAVPMIFGPEYSPAVPSLLLLLPGMVFYAPALIIGEYFIVQRGKPMRAAIFPGTSIVAGIILNLLLTPSLEAAGASIASTVSYAVMLAAALIAFRADTGQRVRAIAKITRADLRKLRRLPLARDTEA